MSIILKMGVIDMIKYKTIIHQYCPVITQNIALEKRLHQDESEEYECLNSTQCKCEKGCCKNTLISEYYSTK